MTDYPFPFFGHRPREASDRERRVYLVRFAAPLGEVARRSLGAEASDAFFGTAVASHALHTTSDVWAAWVIDVDRRWAADARRGYFPQNDAHAIDALSGVLEGWHATAPIAEVIFTGALSEQGSAWDAWSGEQHGLPSEVSGIRSAGFEFRRDGDAWMNADDDHDARVRARPLLKGAPDELYGDAARAAFDARFAQIEGVEPVDSPTTEQAVSASSWSLGSAATLSIERPTLRLVQAGTERMAEPCSGGRGLRLGSTLLIPGDSRTDVVRLDEGSIRFVEPLPATVTAAVSPDMVLVGTRWYRIARLMADDTGPGAPSLNLVSAIPDATDESDVLEPPAGFELPEDLGYVASLPSGHHVMRKDHKLAFMAPGTGAAKTIRRKKERKTDFERLRDVHPSAPRVIVEVGKHGGPLYEALLDELNYRPLFQADGVRARYVGPDRIVALVKDALVLYAHDPSAKVQLQRLAERPFLGGWFGVRHGRVLTVERARKQLRVHVLDASGDGFVEEGPPLVQAGPSHMSKVTEVAGDVYVRMGKKTYALSW